VLIPAHNEEAGIGANAKSLLRNWATRPLARRRDNCEDATAA